MTIHTKKTSRNPATSLTQSPSMGVDLSIPATSPEAEKAKFALDPALGRGCGLSPPGVAPGELSPHAAMPTASASNESSKSTLGKFCRMLTAAKRTAFLALFERDLDLVEMEARAAGHDTANELRRAVNVVWRLLTVEELDFETAITKAAEWVVAQPMHPDELLFADVLTFSRRHDEK